MIRNNSEILMANGSSKRVDHIRVGERILSGNGVRIQVSGLCYKIKTGYIIIITMTNGREIWCNPEQRLFSTNGAKRADGIKVGMDLEIPGGSLGVLEVRWSPFDGILRSLILPACEDERKRLVYANGIAIEVFSN